jgi:cytochrome c-type biogenesis protein CcmF
MQLNGGAPPSYLSSDLPRFTATMEKMDAKDKSVTIQLFYKDPLYPLDVYYKPFTILVWLGTGIMLIGGFWAAWYRRKNLRTPVTETESNTVVEETPENSNTNAAFSAS